MRFFLYIFIITTLLHGQLYTFGNKTFYLQRQSSYVYKDENGKDIKIKSNFFIKLKKNVDIKIILHDYNITIDKQYSKQLYLANSEYDKNILEIIQNINNDENTLFASPNFDIKLQLR